ncbi:MAG: GntR family transcriptional regulator [Chloroflexi bacterium]|nr:GntR family transcriptional regulator [Chloroflexota bacterium]MCI0576876.1 GntR family transcriptional regulator [Chloroflexota bacterium]MCI0646470.1 GntR family transcriptional regulator [Chloroflexota bacterium]MCI0729909.1 GntR family transcriptional regulator [Chloroflexota bacterium]
MNLPIHIDAADPLPLYAQLERGIRLAIATGRLIAGDQLPTVRQLAVDLRVNANTVAKVYAELERAGVLETRRGVGTFVRAVPGEVDTEEARRRQLRQLADRFLMEAAESGFSLPEVLEHLQGRLSLEAG